MAADTTDADFAIAVHWEAWVMYLCCCSALETVQSGLSMVQPTFAEIQVEFEETLGYIRGDLGWLIKNKPNLHYTVALLVGCGCEMLAACRDPKRRHGEIVFAELLPAGDWKVLATRLYGALRDGLAHGFDTKHILVDGKEHQICLNSSEPVQFAFRNSDRGLILICPDQIDSDRPLCQDYRF